MFEELALNAHPHNLVICNEFNLLGGSGLGGSGVGSGCGLGVGVAGGGAEEVVIIRDVVV